MRDAGADDPSHHGGHRRADNQMPELAAADKHLHELADH